MKKYLLALPFVLCHAQDIPPKIRAAERAVVKIASYRFMGSHYDVFHCSGVFLSYGIVATNYHCVGDGSTVSVVPKVPEGEVSPMLPASVIAFSETFDLALIEVQEDDHPGVPAPLGSFSRGEEALYMMGYPNGVFRTLKGKPSKPWFIIKNWFDVGYWHFFDSDPTSQWQFPMGGESGSPIFDEEGRVVGISRGSNIFGDQFFVPSTYLALLISTHGITIPLPYY